MKNEFLNNIKNVLFPKKTACILSDDNDGLNIGISVAEENGMETEKYQDYRKFLYSLHSNKFNGFNIIMIFKNGSTTKTTSVNDFIKMYDPSIKTIVFSNRNELVEKLKSKII